MAGGGIVVPERGQVQAIVAHADSEFRPMVLIAFFCGLRWGEIRGLPKRAVDLDGGYIIVAQAADKYGHIGPPKTGAAHRVVPMPPVVTRELQGRVVGSGLVFAAPGGTPFPLWDIRKQLWKPALEKAGVRHLKMHWCRHFAVSFWAAVQLRERQYIDWHQIAAWIGHTDPAFTMKTYAHLFDEVRQGHDELIHRAAEGVLG